MMESIWMASHAHPVLFWFMCLALSVILLLLGYIFVERMGCLLGLLFAIPGIFLLLLCIAIVAIWFFCIFLSPLATALIFILIILFVFVSSLCR